MKHPAIRPYFGIFTGVAAVSFASIFIRLADAPSLVIASCRLTLASLILAPAVHLRARQELRSLTARDLRLAMVSGLFLALHFALWITSLSYTSVASSVVFVATMPLFVGLISYLFLSEPLTPRMLTGLFIAVAGGMTIGFGDIGLGVREVIGDLLALGGAAMGAGYFLIGRSLRPKLSLLAYICLTYSTAALTLLGLTVLARLPFTGYSQRTYLMFVLLAVVPQIVGHSSFNWALRYLPAIFVTVTTLGEPVGATILAFFILHEAPTLLKIIGGVLILMGIYVASGAESAIVTEEPVGVEA